MNLHDTLTAKLTAPEKELFGWWVKIHSLRMLGDVSMGLEQQCGKMAEFILADPAFAAELGKFIAVYAGTASKTQSLNGELREIMGADDFAAFSRLLAGCNYSFVHLETQIDTLCKTIAPKGQQEARRILDISATNSFLFHSLYTFVLSNSDFSDFMQVAPLQTAFNRYQSAQRADDAAVAATRTQYAAQRTAAMAAKMATQGAVK